ncbi:MAG: hypothetical protein U5K51_03795 [Flavobacteriaceae bacterium]|nr:hypothetical protein [Flavobacteriaceae bacterium]
MQDINKTRSMIELVEQWLESGKSQRQFSSEMIHFSYLGDWIKKHRESQLSHRGLLH